MSDEPASPVSNSDPGNYPGTPRWVKVFGIVILILVLVVVVMMAAGVGGKHGPARHLPTRGADGHAPPAPGVPQP